MERFARSGDYRFRMRRMTWHVLLIVFVLVAAILPIASADPARVLARNSSGKAVAVITESGNLGVVGTLYASTTVPTPSSARDWVLRDSSSNVKALIKCDGDDEGDMYLAGSVLENQTSISETDAIFVSRDSQDNVVAALYTNGQLKLAGEYTDREYTTNQHRDDIGVLNGGLEDWASGLPNHWSCPQGAVSQQLGGPLHFDGAYFARISDSGSDSGILFHDGNNTTYLDPGATYRVTFAAKFSSWASGDSPTVQVRYSSSEDAAVTDVVVVDSTPPNNYWHWFSYEFADVRQLYIACRSNGATLDIDGAQLEEIPNAERIVHDSWWRNLGFEDGDAQWNGQAAGGYEYVSGGIMPPSYASENPLTHTTAAQDTYRGFYAIKLNDQGDEAAFANAWTALNPARTYRLTFHYKILCPSGYSTNDTLVLGYETQSAQTVSTSIQASSWTSNEWQTCDLTFTGESQVSPFASYDDTVGNGGTIFLVDELELREIDTVEFPFVVCESDVGELSIDLPTGPPEAYSETPPSILLGDNKRYLYIGTAYSSVLEVPTATNYIDDSSDYQVQTYYRSATCTVDEAREANGGTYDSDDNVNALGSQWRKNYCGLFSALKVAHGDGTATVLGIFHDENNNYFFEVNGNTYYYTNTVVKGVTYGPDDYSGLVNGVMRDYWPGSHGLICLMTSEYRAETDWGTRFDEPGYTTDDGPIVWPALGYTEDVYGDGSLCTHLSCGVRHPSAFIDGDYIYLTFSDTSPGWELGRGMGHRMARALKSSGGAPGSWHCLFQGAYTEDALPANFDKNNPDYSAQGGRGDLPHPELNWNVYRFTIAKLSDGSGYIGVEHVYTQWESATGGQMAALRFSQDLLHWSPRVWLKETYSTDWDNYDFIGPSFLSADGNSSTVVDPEGFYVVGAHMWGTFGRLWVSLHR